MGKKEKFYADIISFHQKVTGSGTEVIARLPNRENIRFIVDLGLFQEEEYEMLNNKLYFEPEEIDFCLLTHVHCDHSGRLPLLTKNGFKGKIYLSKPSSEFLPFAAKDTYKVLKEKSKRSNTKCIYNESDVEKAMSLMAPIDFNKTITVNDNIKVTFFKNGHLTGAALILVQISFPGYENINLLFTGDYNNKNVFFKVDSLPEWVLELPLTVIQESTYGTMESEIKYTFNDNIQKYIKAQGEIVSLVFSLERAQMILYRLKELQEKKLIDKDVPIYFDGKLAIKYSNLFQTRDLGIYPHMRDFYPENLTIVTDNRRNKIIEDRSSKIIVTTSGMGTYGPAPRYLLEYAKRDNTLVQFTGYTAKGTLGDILKNTQKGEKVQIRGALIKKNADVQYTNEFSSHAKADEMIEFLKKFKNLKLVLVNHGEEETKKSFAGRILDEVETKNVGIMSRQFLFRVNPYGLVKSVERQLE